MWALVYNPDNLHFPKELGDSPKVSRFNLKPWLVLGFLLILSLVVIKVVISANYHASESKPVQEAKAPETTQVVAKAASAAPANEAKTAVASNSVESSRKATLSIRAHDSLTKIFQRNGISAKDAHALLGIASAKALRSLHGGKKIEVAFDPVSKKLQQLSYDLSDLDTLTVSASGDYWRVQTKHAEPTTKLEYVSATIKGSIYTAGAKAGLSRKTVGQLMSIFSSKINFKKVHNGDRFALFYKNYFVKGKKVKEGEIAAAEFNHDKQITRVIAFTDPKGKTGYYTPEGYSLIPPFLRYPLRFTRVSSRFTLARYHPILGIVCAHLGVDLAAPFGTRINASSDGKIVYAGWKGNAGRAIIIQHGIYSTLYAHLSRIARNIHVGTNVKQGELIGYVGQSGLANGPHLHYEFRINGIHYDPLRVRLPAGEMIAVAYRKQFFAVAKEMLARLDLERHDHTMIAMN